MVENFMDYSSDYCMDRFSPDGVTRMRSQLLLYRASLLDENNLACGIPNGLDVKISNILAPNVGCNPVMSGVNYEIRNLGSDTLTETTINYYVNDQTGTLIWTGNLGFGGFGPVNITVEAVPIGDINSENNTATFEYDNYEGAYVDVEIDFDALPYGIEWELYEVVNGNLVNPPIHSFGNYDNEIYSCNNVSHTFCLPEGDYQIVVTDLFNNGLSYSCGNTSGDFTIVTGTDTLNYYQGGWTGDLDLPFTVNSDVIPSEVCLNLTNVNPNYDEYNGTYNRDSDLKATLSTSYGSNEYDLVLSSNPSYTSWTGTTVLGSSGGIVFLSETFFDDYSPFILLSGTWADGETVRVKLELTYDNPNVINGISVPSEINGITWGTCQ
jgi:hypothetical protein